MWTGDGRPDKLTAEYAKGVDVFVTEAAAGPGLPPMSKRPGCAGADYQRHIDLVHTPTTTPPALTIRYSRGWGWSRTSSYDERPHQRVHRPGWREHWKGLFAYGAPDGVVVNVTKDAIWSRMAAMSDAASPARPSKDVIAKYLFDLKLGHLEVDFPGSETHPQVCAGGFPLRARDRQGAVLPEGCRPGSGSWNSRRGTRSRS